MFSVVTTLPRPLSEMANMIMTLEISPHFHEAWALLGASEKVSDEVYQSVEKLTCKMNS